MAAQPQDEVSQQQLPPPPLPPPKQRAKRVKQVFHQSWPGPEPVPNGEQLFPSIWAGEDKDGIPKADAGPAALGLLLSTSDSQEFHSTKEDLSADSEDVLSQADSRPDQASQATAVHPPTASGSLEGASVNDAPAPASAAPRGAGEQRASSSAPSNLATSSRIEPGLLGPASADASVEAPPQSTPSRPAVPSAAARVSFAAADWVPLAYLPPEERAQRQAQMLAIQQQAHAQGPTPALHCAVRCIGSLYSAAGSVTLH